MNHQLSNFLTILMISKTALADNCLAFCLFSAVAVLLIVLSRHSNVNEGACDGPHEEMQENSGL